MCKDLLQTAGRVWGDGEQVLLDPALSSQILGFIISSPAVNMAMISSVASIVSGLI